MIATGTQVLVCLVAGHSLFGGTAMEPIGRCGTYRKRYKTSGCAPGPLKIESLSWLTLRAIRFLTSRLTCFTRPNFPSLLGLPRAGRTLSCEPCSPEPWSFARSFFIFLSILIPLWAIQVKVLPNQAIMLMRLPFLLSTPL